MLAAIAQFQFCTQLRRRGFLFALGALMLLGYATPILLAIDETGKYVNSPFSIATNGASLLPAVIIGVMMLGLIPLADTANWMGEVIRSKPVSGPSYLLGKFLGGLSAGASMMVALLAAMEVGTWTWSIDPKLLGAFSWQANATALTVFLLPNLFITGAILFTFTSLSRSQPAIWLGIVLLIGLSVTAMLLTGELRWRALAALIDPFGEAALNAQTVYWTPFERNTHQVPIGGFIIWNRVLWCAIAAILLALSAALFRWQPGAGRWLRRSTERRSAAGATARFTIRCLAMTARGEAGLAAQLLTRVRHELRAILRSVAFWIMLLLGAGSCWLALEVMGRTYDTPLLPVTQAVAEVVALVSTLVGLTIVVIFGANQVWRDRDVKIAAIVDATPTPSFVFAAANLVALLGALALILTACMATGIAYQLVGGVTGIEISIYLVKLFVVVAPSVMILAVLSTLIQVLVNQKFVALLAFGALMIGAPIGLANLHIRDPLLVYSSHPDVPLSDLNGAGHFLAVAAWFLAYWSCIALLLVIASGIMWVRGARSTIVTRLMAVPRSVTRPVAAAALLAVTGAATTGGYIYWNTHVRNESETTAASERLQVAFERAYADYLLQPQPRISTVEIAVDLIPERRAYRSHGRYTLTNRNADALDTVRIQFPFGLNVEDIQLSDDAVLVEANRKFNHFVFKLGAPLAPGASRTLTFAVSDTNEGFTNGSNVTPVIGNGSFVHSAYLAPSIGVSRDLFLRNKTRRRAHGLVAYGDLPQADNQAKGRRNYISGDSDFVHFGITVSTGPDQTALAPGYLQREWTENGRRYFRYEMDKPILNFWAVLSARYTVARAKWNDVEIAVYHHASHDANVARMIESVKASLAYYSESFSPYQYRQLRIVEFPKYLSAGIMAQAFPNIVPYSEASGFIVDNRNPKDLDHVWYVTAHEVAHMWWAHQVVGADRTGATFLSETLAQYSALMVMERRYGPDRMRRLLKHELDAYLKGHAKSSEEDPLVTVWHHEQHVQYRKGAVAMYALKDAIGEAAVNRALAALLRGYAYKSDPYPTSRDLLKLLRMEAGPEHQELITDLFEKVVLWDLGVESSEVSPTADGKWRVRLTVSGKKLQAKSNGEEAEAPLDQPIDIGLFAADPANATFSAGDVILLEKRWIKSGPQLIEFVVDRKPSYVGIDPYVKLIQRSTERNVVAVRTADG